jgi:hypothetical protein
MRPFFWPMRASSWNQISIFYLCVTPWRWAASVRGSFLVNRDDLAILPRAPRAGADVGEVQRLQELADGPLVVVDAVALGDHLLQINPAPAHHAMHGAVRAGLHDLRQLLLLRRRGLPGRRLSFSPSGPNALNRCAQSLSVCRSMPPILVASARPIPSRTAPIDSSRRLWFAFLPDAAKRRSSTGVWLGLISTTFVVAHVLHAP